MLQVTNISEFKRNFEKYLLGISESNNKVIVHNSGKSVMILSLDEYEKFEKIDETEYLLGNEANKAMMEEAIKQINEGKAIQIDTNELEKLISQNDIPEDYTQ